MSDNNHHFNDSSVDARLYMDRRCVYYKKPLLESGTLGTMGNTQVWLFIHLSTYQLTSFLRDKISPVDYKCSLKEFEAILSLAKGLKNSCLLFWKNRAKIKILNLRLLCLTWQNPTDHPEIRQKNQSRFAPWKTSRMLLNTAFSGHETISKATLLARLDLLSNT